MKKRAWGITAIETLNVLLKNLIIIEQGHFALNLPYITHYGEPLEQFHGKQLTEELKSNLRLTNNSMQ